MDLIYSDQELDDRLARLNTLYRGFDGGWASIKAQKDHVDAFGDPISQGHLYYGRKVDFRETVRLSRKSMDMFLYCFFENNPWLSHVTEQVLKEQMETAKKRFGKLSPLKNIKIKGLSEAD